LWIWHASFGYAGTLNDINIWEQSPLLNAFTDGTFTKCIDFEFTIGNTKFDKVWLLVDGIYPDIARFAKTLNEAVGEDRKLYVRWQESCRKSIERAFGVLQRKFQILKNNSEEFYLHILKDSLVACVIMHNMMVEHRVSKGEVESEKFYEYDRSEGINDIIIDSTEEKFERQVAELNLAIQLEKQFSNSSYTKFSQAEQDARSSWFSFNQEVSLLRWKQLYDTDSHFKLREAIITQLKINQKNTSINT
jgi:Plant transposon protein